MSEQMSFWERQWRKIKAELKRKHPDWDPERISRTAARKLERAKDARS